MLYIKLTYKTQAITQNTNAHSNTHIYIYIYIRPYNNDKYKHTSCNELKVHAQKENYMIGPHADVLNLRIKDLDPVNFIVSGPFVGI